MESQAIVLVLELVLGRSEKQLEDEDDDEDDAWQLFDNEGRCRALVIQQPQEWTSAV